MLEEPFNLFNEYQTNDIKKYMDQSDLLDKLLLYGYKIERYSGSASTEEKAEEIAEAMSNNIIPIGKVINLSTREKFEIMLRDLTDLFNDSENFFAFEMFKFKNRNDK